MQITASYLRHFLANTTHPSGEKLFEVLDGRDTCCLPVVAVHLNPKVGLHYDDIDMQHALSESHWYVSGYSLGFENPENKEVEDLFTDDQGKTMFRIVVKSNITQSLAENLADHIKKVLEVLDDLDGGYESIHSKFATLKEKMEEKKEQGTAIPDDKRKQMRKLVFWEKSFKAKFTRKTAIVAQHIC